MKTLEVTDEQHAVIQHLRDEIAERIVGKYGHVRDRDAIQFLIDNYDGSLDTGVSVDSDPIGPGATDTGVDGVSDATGVSDTADSTGVTDADVVDSADETAVAGADDENDVPGGTGGEAVSFEEPGEDAGPATANDGTTDDGTTGDASPADDGSASDDDMLDRMMNLLDTHDDKWTESPSADYRYRVELPDGGTEDVQTKDDVRALLFKHY